MVITNVFFTAGAQELAKSTGCRLVDRNELTNWILAFQQHR
jgi:HJR/Mrr/RecB family endonuclease